MEIFGFLEGLAVIAEALITSRDAKKKAEEEKEGRTFVNE